MYWIVATIKTVAPQKIPRHNFTTISTQLERSLPRRLSSASTSAATVVSHNGFSGGLYVGINFCTDIYTPYLFFVCSISKFMQKCKKRQKYKKGQKIQVQFKKSCKKRRKCKKRQFYIQIENSLKKGKNSFSISKFIQKRQK